MPLTKICSPSNPYTIEGTPARFEMLVCNILVTQFLGAYSSRYIAAETPTGKAIIAVVPITQSEPQKADLKPA